MKKVFVLILAISIFATTFPAYAEVIQTAKISNQNEISSSYLGGIK